MHISDPTGCDVTLNVTNAKQYITTYGYPLRYPLDLTCHFNFLAPPGERIVVVFEDVQLELDYDFIIFRKSELV